MPDEPSARIDASVPHSARVWNYWLGGKDNFEIDRMVGEQALRAAPALRDVARAARAHLVRAVTYLAAEEGVRQFLDVGTGLPTADNTHEVAQRVAPESRVVYVDNDPLVLAHARALLTSTPEGVTTYIDADATDTGRILDEARKVLDLSRPVALILAGILGHFRDDEAAHALVRDLLAPLPAGSFLVINDGTNVVRAKEFSQAEEVYNERAESPFHLRTPEEIGRFFDGLDLIEPGVVSAPFWRPEPGSDPVELDVFGGVGRKP
ncbi:SAM-dependent methyltransferase [Actinomadura hibisca]|uniref:SAM-dependent methyltransferase n=1 Tax=Actinomadura hibisca TaxID=68565 RepID=UPI000B00E3F1|nr:SAM-dependent methyltransferase [Actinomadura hibisca]